MPFSSYDDRYIQRELGIPAREAKELRERLVAEGFLELTKRHGEGWEPTTKGLALALASAAKPITRATAERALREFLARVEKVNATPEYAYKVARVAVFGSFLTDVARLNDVDLMVEMVHRRETIEKHVAHCKERIRLARRRGRPRSSMGQELMWPSHEVLLLLKSRSRAIALHDWDDHTHFLDSRPHRIIFDAGLGSADSTVGTPP